MKIIEATNPDEWDSFLASQEYSPFLQSWTMGEVYREIGQDPLRLILLEEDAIVGICQATIVPARRGRHLAILYGPLLSEQEMLEPLVDVLKQKAREHACSFIRLSPFLPLDTAEKSFWPPRGCLSSPLHLLAEHLWILDLQGKKESDILAGMRKTTRNLLRRAQREGVVVTASAHPLEDIDAFLKLHEETRRRHRFTPYTDTFFRAQLAHFSKRDQATLYLAHYQGEIMAASIHMHMFGETSYHHGASTAVHAKVPASTLLQWTAITDALKRGDRLYNFWGVAPEGATRHPFHGVTTFKTGFGGSMLPLVHCIDVPVSAAYYATRAFEYVRKWQRGF